MGSFNIDYCIHAANILLLAAYSVRDILWLRLFAVASSLIAIPYFIFQPIPLWAGGQLECSIYRNQSLSSRASFPRTTSRQADL
jgi:hypothetical protein